MFHNAQTSCENPSKLAQYRIPLPRLAGPEFYVNDKRGGIGMRGPGETEIETAVLFATHDPSQEKTLKNRQANETRRSNRGALVPVPLLGYTNVGKSTLMNVISKNEVFAENKLCPLDTTVRKLVFDLPFLLKRYRKFIRKLPTQLVESFKRFLR